MKYFNCFRTKKKTKKNDSKTNCFRTKKKTKKNDSKTKSLRQTGVPPADNKKQIANSQKNNGRHKSPPPLINIGANCYLNSAFQGISSCHKFVEEIYKLQQKSSQNFKKLMLFNQIMLILNGNKGNRIELSRNEIFRNWNKPGQQDSFELLSYVINQVYNEIKNKNDKYKNNFEEWLNVHLPLRLIVKNRISCGCNIEIETPRQIDLALHVPIPSEKNLDLQQLINNFFKKEQIEGYSCDSPGCNGKKATRSTILCKPLPHTICIHLQRSYWNGHQMVKKSNKINFTDSIIIKSKFCCDNTSSAINEKEKNDEIFTKDNSKSPGKSNSETQKPNISTCDKQYNLTSVIVHFGSVNGGHYICYKRFDDRWFRTDDSRISAAKKDDVLKSEAYILFYESDT